MSDDRATSEDIDNEKVSFATHIARKVALNWYECEFADELDLLREYASGIEQQIANSIEAFKRKEAVIVKRRLITHDSGYYKEIYRGIDSSNYDLDGVFMYHFPSLQRSSALITLYGVFEHELDYLCSMITKERDYGVQVNDIHGKGIERALKYLEKVAGLEINKIGKTWAEFKAIQRIRNLAVHNGSKLIDKEGKPYEAEIKYVSSSPFLDGKAEIIFLDGFLTHTIDVFDSLSKDIDTAIQDKFLPKPEPLPPEIEEYIKNLPPL